MTELLGGLVGLNDGDDRAVVEIAMNPHLTDGRGRLGLNVERDKKASHRATVDRAPVVQVARLPFPAGDGGANPTLALHFAPATVAEVNPLLAANHYLGPVKAGRFAFAGWASDVLVACQVWRWPTARMLPSDGSWLELSRWCLTPDAGKNAGSRMMGWVRRWIRANAPSVTTLVSYSDPVHGHTGAVYRASGWTYTPTHHGLRYDSDGVGYKSGHGKWSDNGRVQSPKHRWTCEVAA